MSERVFLVADIGGTHARFALARSESEHFSLGPSSVWLTSLYPDLETALTDFLAAQKNPALDAVALCAAGPVEGEGKAASISLTNCPWKVSAERVAQATGVAHPLLMNDFTAMALAVPHLAESELHPVGGGEKMKAPIAILGPGTGLGVSGLVPLPGEPLRYLPVSGEGGHVDLAPTNAREISVLYQLMQEYGRVSAERVLSGAGLVALYMALGALSGAAEKGRPTPVDIASRARSGASPVAAEAVELFCAWLGSVAGNLALTLGAKGGVYIGGGIVPGWLTHAPGLFNEALFRHRFEAKGRFKPWLADIPVFVIRREDPALLGLAYAAKAMHDGDI